MGKAEILEKEEYIVKFLKDAWLVDGLVKPKGNSFVIIGGKYYQSSTFELNDSRRGKFYVTLHTEGGEITAKA